VGSGSVTLFLVLRVVKGYLPRRIRRHVRARRPDRQAPLLVLRVSPTFPRASTRPCLAFGPPNEPPDADAQKKHEHPQQHFAARIEPGEGKLALIPFRLNRRLGWRG